MANSISLIRLLLPSVSPVILCVFSHNPSSAFLLFFSSPLPTALASSSELPGLTKNQEFKNLL